MLVSGEYYVVGSRVQKRPAGQVAQSDLTGIEFHLVPPKWSTPLT